MGLLSRILAAMVALMGTSLFIALIVTNTGFRMMFWNVTGQNILYAGVGLIAFFASIIALSNWLWKMEY